MLDFQFKVCGLKDEAQNMNAGNMIVIQFKKKQQFFIGIIQCINSLISHKFRQLFVKQFKHDVSATISHLVETKPDMCQQLFHTLLKLL